MKNSNEWFNDINEKVAARYEKRRKKRKLALRISSSVTCFAIILCAILILPNLTNGNMTTDTPNSNINQTLDNVAGNSTPEVNIETSNNTSNKPNTPSSNDNAPNPPSTPFNEPTKPNDDISNFNFKVNEISGQISASKKYLNPKEHRVETWSEQQMSNYYKIDLTNIVSKSFLPKYLSYVKRENYTVTLHNSGNIVEDFVSSSFIDSTGESNRKLIVLMSKIGTPYDHVYSLENSDVTSINNVSVLIGGMKKSKGSTEYGFYFADFKYKDINYRVKADGLTSEEFYKVISELTNK